MVTDFPLLREKLATRVLARTGRRVRHLAIDLAADCVVLRGLAVNFHVKQLAQQGIRDVLPDVRLENAIQVP